MENKFIRKIIKFIFEGCSTYTRSYVEKPDAQRPSPCRPGAPDSFIGMGSDQQFPKSVNCITYRQYNKTEQASAARKPIILKPEFGKIPNRSKTDVEVCPFIVFF